MIKISQEQARARFKTLPSSLQGAVFSTLTAETVARACERGGFDRAKTTALAEIVGLILMGFLRVEDATAEIQERTNLPLQEARGVLQSLTARIFAPLRADLDRAYSPLQESLSSETVRLEKKEGDTRIIEEIKKLEKSGEELVEVLRKVEEEKGGLQRPSPPIYPKPAPVSPYPAPISTPKKVETKITFPSPTIPVEPKIPSPILKPKEEKVDFSGPIGPVIIHEESGAGPLAGRSGFHLEIPTQRFSNPLPATPRPEVGPARVEIGGQSPIKNAGPSKTDVVQPSRNVNYSSPPRSAPAFNPLVSRGAGVAPEIPAISDPRQGQGPPAAKNSRPSSWFARIFGKKIEPAGSGVKVVNISAPKPQSVINRSFQAPPPISSSRPPVIEPRSSLNAGGKPPEKDAREIHPGSLKQNTSPEDGGIVDLSSLTRR